MGIQIFVGIQFDYITTPWTLHEYSSLYGYLEMDLDSVSHIMCGWTLKLLK